MTLGQAIAALLPEAIDHITSAIASVAASPDPVDAARRLAEEAARQLAFDRAMTAAKG